jgi:hypothetical protein
LTPSTTRSREEPKRHEADALAASGLTHDAEHLSVGERERQAIDRVHRAVVGVESHREPLDFEQAHRVVRGSKTSRSPSPSRLNDSEQRKIAMPG